MSTFSTAKTISMEPPETFRIKDGPAQRVVGIQDGILAYTAITGSRTKEVRHLPGDEFLIYLKVRILGPLDFKVVKKSRNGPGSLDLELYSKNPPLKLLLHYRQDPGGFYIKKWLEILPDPGTSLFVDRIILERFKPWTPPLSFAGPGQPVYVGDTFWGVAYPSADNKADGDMVECSYLVGLTVGENGYVSRQSVYGVSEPGKVREAFFEYVGRIRARPAEPFLLYNTWYDLREFNGDDVINSINGFNKHLVEPYDIKLDSVVLDDRWDGFLELWRPHRRRFPDGFNEVSSAAGTVGARLGLWMSPLGGYPANQWMRLLGTAGKGYEKSPNGFCIAGDKYRDAFADRMVEYIEDEGVNYYKLDNLTTFCSNPAHGHRIGKYNQVGLTDAFISVIERARAASPQVMINITVGSWLSPWWLMYCDVVWRGGMDYGFIGAGSRRQKSITYVDNVLYKRLIEEESQYPISSLMTHGIIKGRRQHFREQGPNLRDFADDAWMYFGRGVMMQELYLTPEMVSPDEWKALADAIKFAHTNAKLLAQSEMVLGDPGAGEVYGFFHKRDDERLLYLRNPSETAQQFTMPEAMDTDNASTCQVAYSSTNRNLNDPLDSLEVRVVYCSLEE